MFGLEKDEFAALAAATLLAARVLCSVGKVLWWYAADAPRVAKLHPLTPFLTGVAVALLAVALLSIATGWPLRGVRLVAYAAAALGGFVLGIVFDFTLDFRLYEISDRLMARRVPRYREQLLYGDSDSRIHAARQLASLGARTIPARPELLAAFKDESAEVRAAVARAVLYSIPDPPDDDPELPKAARLLLADPDLTARVSAAAILVAYGAPAAEVLPALCEGVKSADPNVGGDAASAIGRLGPAAESAIPALRESVLAQDSPNYSVLATLGKIGPAAVPVLVEVLERGDSTGKWMAANALAEMGEPARAALPALRKLTAHPDLTARAAAQTAIKKLGGDIS